MKIKKIQIWRAKRTLKRLLKRLKKKDYKFYKFLSYTNQVIFEKLNKQFKIKFKDFKFSDLEFLTIDDRFFWFVVKINDKKIKIPVIRERFAFDISGTGKFGVIILRNLNIFFELEAKE